MRMRMYLTMRLLLQMCMRMCVCLKDVGRGLQNAEIECAWLGASAGLPKVTCFLSQIYF